MIDTEGSRLPGSDDRGFDVFRDDLSQAFVPVVAEEGADGFRGRIRLADLGSMRLAHIVAGAHTVHRTAKIIRRGDPDFYKLSLQSSGRSLLRQADRDSILTAGDMALYDTNQPYDLRLDGPFEMIVLFFPRNLLNLPERSMKAISGRRISGDNSLPRLITPFMTGLTERMNQHAPETNRLLGDALLDMLAAATADELGIDETSSGSRQPTMLREVKDYIEENLGDLMLDPTSIAAAHHISPRYLRKLFEAEGESASRWIRKRRLEGCRRDLGTQDLAHLSVSRIASQWGFTDAAHFSRLFRSTYGQSPREFRQNIQMASSPSPFDEAV